MNTQATENLNFVNADLAYTASQDEPGLVRVFPPSSGRELERPWRERVSMPVYDCRPVLEEMTLDVAGFEVLNRPTPFNDWYDADAVKANYYPEVSAILKQATGALEVFVFDHNVRNQPRSDRGESGVREPVDGAHNDYTLASGPKRINDILSDENATHLAGKRAALINLWRPIVGPVEDHPLAICDARTTNIKDFLPTRIEHFLEGDLEQPHHVGEIYSFCHSPEHRWFYVSSMQPDEVMLLKCFDSANDGRAIFTGHTGFRNPDCPKDFIPRESIEARTVVVFPE